MKILASSLFCFVLAASQCLAIPGGPAYGGRGIRTTGIYAGVMLGQAGSNSIGLYSLTIPKTNLGTGNVIIFGAGRAYTGTIQGVADPDTAKLIAAIDAAFLSRTGGTGDTSQDKTETAAGQLQGQMAANRNTFSSASVRIVGTANVEFSLAGQDPFSQISYDVFGFKQAEITQ